MDPSDPPRPPPRRELQGPRPSPLKVRKDSVVIKKPPLPPSSIEPPPPRAPVVIYSVSPKVIHIDASDFMSLVQSLTGLSPSPNSPPAASALSPAARVAAFTPSRTSPGAADRNPDLEIDGGGGGGGSSPPGILSPIPSALPSPVSPGFFAADGFLRDLSPMFVPSPTTWEFINQFMEF
ncbi:Protein MKS1 [Acorus gramineus]|uniref:Protein MKS1 n=1 Tax=Acorus gramineus TaxID=55184 RepID=A0AAV9BIK5_ACOGR|nr:Protein MKS1 [Acorus gramineus]